MFKPSSTHAPEPASVATEAPPWCVLIADDEPIVHIITRMALRDMVFAGRGVAFHSAHSAEEARALIDTVPEIAVAFIDVEMETDHAGLDLVSHIRNVRRNLLMRIVLRTGQPGVEEERATLHGYDINAYLDKSGSDATRLYPTLLIGLRTFCELTRLHDAMRQLESMAGTDPLTGLGSQGHLRSALLRALSSARRRAEPLSLVSLDLDDFKRINELQGYRRGDEVLRAVGSAILARSRTEDGCFRYGGDEFVVILPSCNAEQARLRYCSRLAGELERIGVGASIGVAQTAAEGVVDPEGLLQLAAADLWARKRARIEATRR